MKNRKTILIVSFLLLVCVVSLSYAYFTAQNDIGELEDNALEQQTATLNGTIVTLAGERLKASGNNVYPGHKEIVKLTVSALHNNGPVNYNLEWVGQNSLTSEVTYKIYKSEQNLEPKITCETVSIPGQTEIHYYEECSISEFGTLESAGAYKEDVIEHADIETTQGLLYYEEITGEDPAKVVYYYVVIEYPNDPNKPQDDDAEKGYSGSFKLNIGTKTKKIQTSIGELEVNMDTPDFGKSSCLNGTNGTSEYKVSRDSNCGEETNGIYEARTSLGKTYYYRGSVNNNWVKYGKVNEPIEVWSIHQYYEEMELDSYSGHYKSQDECQASGLVTQGKECTLMYSSKAGDDMWWRIIRINEDETIRLIYAGTGESPAVNEQVDGKDGYWTENKYGIGTFPLFNSLSGQNAYVGYMYGTPGSETFEAEHGYDLIDAGTPELLKSSDIKQTLDDWYVKNLEDEGDVLSGSTGFCGDRSLGTGYEGKGYGKETTIYQVYERMTAKKPSYDCLNSHDLYTTKNNKGKGNGALDYPIGLITADELLFAGAGQGENNFGNYLFIGGGYWTITPSANAPSGTLISTMGTRGLMSSSNSTINFNPVYPVVNVLPDYFKTDGHDGTINNPYVVTAD